MLNAQLAPHERGDGDDARRKRADGGGADAGVGLKGARAHQDAVEAHGVEHAGRHVEVVVLPRAPHDVFQQEDGERNDHDGHGAERHEHGVPPPQVDEEPRDGGADGGREPDDEAHEPHGLAVLAFRVDGQRHHLDERKRDAGAARLQQARGEQERVVRRDERRRAAHGEACHGRQEELFRAHVVDQVRRHGRDEAEREDVGGGEQLAERGVDVEIVHDGGQRCDHHALRDAGCGGAGHHDADDERALALRQAVLVCSLFFVHGDYGSTAAGALQCACGPRRGQSGGHDRF